MTGPEHYAKAEEHLAKADAIETDGHDDGMSAWHQRQAAVHATLALAGAVGNNDTASGQTVHESNAWYRVSGSKPEHADAEVLR